MASAARCEQRREVWGLRQRWGLRPRLRPVRPQAACCSTGGVGQATPLPSPWHHPRHSTCRRPPGAEPAEPQAHRPRCHCRLCPQDAPRRVGGRGLAAARHRRRCVSRAARGVAAAPLLPGAAAMAATRLCTAALPRLCHLSLALAHLWTVAQTLLPAPPPTEIISIVTEECFDDLDAPPERITGAEVRQSPASGLNPTLWFPTCRCSIFAFLRPSIATALPAGAHAVCCQPRGGGAAAGG